MIKKNAYFIIFFIFTLALVIYFKPELTGYSIINSADYNLGMNFAEDSSFVVNISGELSSAALSGNLSGEGSAVVYFDNLTILNKSTNCTEIYDCKNIENITVVYAGEKEGNISVYNKHGNKLKFMGYEDLINNSFTTDKIAKGNSETMFAIDDENSSFSYEEVALCNISKGNFSIIICGKKCSIEKECNTIVFENECIETCNLSRGYNKGVYNITVIIKDSELFLDRLSYILLMDNSTENNETNISESITLLDLIPNQTWEKNTNKTDAINLSNYFNGSNLRYNYSGNNMTNITIDEGVVSFYQPFDWIGNDSVKFTAYNNFSSLDSNEVMLIVSGVIPAPSTPSSGGGGGGGGSSKNIEEFPIQEKAVSNVVETGIKETCDDGIKNQDEIGIDCGGVCKECVIDKAEIPTGMAVYIGNIFGNISYNLIALVLLIFMLLYIYRARLLKIKLK